MKKKNLLALLFALIFMFISVLPAFAEGEEPVPEEEAVQQTEDTIQSPEDEPAVNDPEPDPLDLPVPASGEEPPAVLPETPDEGEDVPPAPEAPQDPGTEEAPTPGDNEDPNAPQDPVGGEAPDEGEEPDPVDEENPDEEVPGEEDPDEEEPDPDAEAEELFIDVLVPASGQVTINPYHMKVATSTGEATEQIVHESQMLLSYTDRPLLVSAQVIGWLKPESEARFVFAPPADDAVDKEIFMYVEFQNDPTFWTGSYSDWANQILVTDWGTEKENVMALDAFGAGYFRIFGAMTNDPDDMWASVDAPDVIISFSFAELPGAAETDAFPEMLPEASPEAPDTLEPFPEEALEPFPEDALEPLPEEFPQVPPGIEVMEPPEDVSEQIF